MLDQAVANQTAEKTELANGIISKTWTKPKDTFIG